MYYWKEQAVCKKVNKAKYTCINMSNNIMLQVYTLNIKK